MSSANFPRHGVTALLPTGLICLIGCGAAPAELLPASAAPTEGRLEPSTAAKFMPGVPLEWTGETAALFEVPISHTVQLDAWDLGPVPRGGVLDLEISASGAEIAFGLFDHSGAVQWIQGHHGGRSDLFQFWLAPGPLDGLSLVVRSTRTSTDAGYLMRLEGGDPRPQNLPASQPGGPRRQVVALNFDGAGGVPIGDEPPADIGPFDAAELDPGWEPERPRIISGVRAHLEQIYEGLGIDFVVADAAHSADPEVTVLHFGSWDPERIGVADRVDYGNRFRNEQAVIYAGNFARYASYGYGPGDIARGLANVAAHELGHLLGLEHTIEPNDVMNVSASVAVLVGPQYLRPGSALDPQVFPVGRQEAAERIFEVVGGDWDAVLAARRRFESEIGDPRRPTAIGSEAGTQPWVYHCTPTRR